MVAWKQCKQGEVSIFWLYFEGRADRICWGVWARSRITPKFYGLCRWKGKLTFAYMQDYEQSKLDRERTISGAQSGHVSCEAPTRHPTKVVEKTDTWVWSSEERSSWRYKLELSVYRWYLKPWGRMRSLKVWAPRALQHLEDTFFT